MTKAVILENKDIKKVISPNYNYIFNKNTGFFARWGATQEEDPQFSPFGPEIADIEISTVCSGVDGVGVCKFCYKSNTPKGDNMSLETFKKVFKNLPKTVTQIAFGIGNLPNHKHGGNPDMWSIFDYCNENGVKPNVTVNGQGVDDETADRLGKTCGGVAVSVYDKNISYDAIKKLTDRGMQNVNIHFMICEQTFDKAKEVINDVATDDRLKNLHALVLLSLKPHGRGANTYYTQLPQEKFNELVDYALEKKIPIGFDSCSAIKSMYAFENKPNYDQILQSIEPCESTLFSMYINTDGMYFPCSFMEGENVENGGDWTEGIDLTADNLDFMKDVWHHNKTKIFRNKCISCRDNKVSCSHYTI